MAQGSRKYSYWSANLRPIRGRKLSVKGHTSNNNHPQYLLRSRTTIMELLAKLISFVLFTSLATGLKFDLLAHPGHESASKERCIRNFVAKDQLVVVTATVSGSRGDGMILNMHVS